MGPSRTPKKCGARGENVAQRRGLGARFGSCPKKSSLSKTKVIRYVAYCLVVCRVCIPLWAKAAGHTRCLFIGFAAPEPGRSELRSRECLALHQRSEDRAQAVLIAVVARSKSSDSVAKPNVRLRVKPERRAASCNLASTPSLTIEPQTTHNCRLIAGDSPPPQPKPGPTLGDESYPCNHKQSLRTDPQITRNGGLMDQSSAGLLLWTDDNQALGCACVNLRLAQMPCRSQRSSY